MARAQVDPDAEPRLRELARGDVAAIVWPVGSEYSDVDRALRGEVVFVCYRGECRGDYAYVRVVDPDTLRELPGGPYVVVDVQVEAVVRRRARQVMTREGVAVDREGDRLDPLARLSPPPSKPDP
jgi:hypothetical protein